MSQVALSELLEKSDSAKKSTGLTTTQVNEIRCAGNQSFAKGNYAAALSSYSRCVSECLKSLSLAGVEHVSNALLKKAIAESSEVGNAEGEITYLREILNTLLLAWSNRAETFLRLKQYDNALADAERALELEPTNLKCLNRKGKALEARQEFEKANLCFLAAFKQSPQDPDIRESMKRTKICFQQSQQGDYDLSKFYLSGCKGFLDPCCDYVGPVEIRRVSSGGRGLFLTTDVVAGELLFVSNALAVAPILPEPPIILKGLQFQSREHDALIAKLSKVAQKSLKCKYQLLILPYKDSAYADSEQEMEIPSMDLFKPGSDWKPMDSESLDLDMGRLSGIAHFSTYNLHGHTADITEFYNPRQVKRTGVWPLPSFLYHSCYPNCLRMHVGNAMFVRATRDIPTGELLTTAWFDVADPLRARQDSSRKWGFLCRCDRCIFEDGIQSLDEMGRSFFNLVQVKREELTVKLANLLPGVEDIIRSLDNLESKHKNWIRASCIYAYIAQSELLRNDLEHKIPFLDVIVESVTSVSGAGMCGLEYSCELLRDVGIHFGRTSDEYAKTEKRVINIFRIAFGTRNKKALVNLIQNFQKALEAIRIGHN